MSLTIIKPGLLDTLQDQGRAGYSRLGINRGGVMDRYAAQVANMLVGNDTNEAVIEIHFPGAQFLFEQNTLISITGGNYNAMLNDEPVPLWHPIVVRKNAILHFPKLQNGSRCYLAVHGGFCVSKWLNSYSTHLKAAAGGFHGRKLEKGDEISFKETSIYFAGLLKPGKEFEALKWGVDTGNTYEHPNEIFFIPGNEWEQLTNQSKDAMVEDNFTIHPFSDRMGYQLKGVDLKRHQNTELVSSAVSFGTIQLLPNGQLIVLMADHQTTGGYPRIGHVISAHLPKLAQLRPSDCIHFIRTDIDKAEQLLIAQQQELNILQRACMERLNSMVC
ncbi:MULTISPECIES: 5-oxoprolinase subunit C family protein [Niastella]|uniref:Biotin-dependent carboxyltransferase family protein n=1 Tax=Niastella soli TaxID=2821487 RepID=A0ABS3YYJ1_9BACT|nr:biotin-dependent carboxyltransferase family protein [Niastella soli]MBO9202226.1 biotin-dependent carboxyltransferase family protein [Niastella soli]